MDYIEVKEVLENIRIVSNGSHSLEQIAEAFDLIEQAVDKQIAEKPMAIDAFEKLDKIERIVQFEVGDRHDIERMVLEVIRGE